MNCVWSWINTLLHPPPAVIPRVYYMPLLDWPL